MLSSLPKDPEDMPRRSFGPQRNVTLKRSQTTYIKIRITLQNFSIDAHRTELNPNPPPRLDVVTYGQAAGYD
jgi:hypothetical protein